MFQPHSVLRSETWSRGFFVWICFISSTSWLFNSPLWLFSSIWINEFLCSWFVLPVLTFNKTCIWKIIYYKVCLRSSWVVYCSVSPQVTLVLPTLLGFLLFSDFSKLSMCEKKLWSKRSGEGFWKYGVTCNCKKSQPCLIKLAGWKDICFCWTLRGLS